MAYQQVLSEVIPEHATAFLNITFFDENEDGFMPTTVKATLYDAKGKALIMDGLVAKRDHQALLNGSGDGINGAEAFIDSTDPDNLKYGIKLFLDEKDTVSVGADTKSQIENRVLLIEWFWDSGEKQNAVEILFSIANMLFRPEA